MNKVRLLLCLFASVQVWGDGRKAETLRAPGAGYEVTYPNDWKMVSPDAENEFHIQLAAPDESVKIVINPFSPSTKNSAADYLAQYAERSGYGKAYQFKEVNSIAKTKGAAAGHQGVYLWQGLPIMITVYTTPTKVYLIEMMTYRRGHPKYSAAHESDAYAIINTLRIGKIKNKAEAIKDGSYTAP